MEGRNTEEPLEARAFSARISILRALLMLDEFEFRVESVIAFGEQIQNETTRWANQLILRPDYTGPVACIPWEKDSSEQITRPTALDVCTVLLRSVYATLVPERPVLWGSSPDWSVAADRIDEYVKVHQEAIGRRLANLYASINVTEWFRTIALAEIELSKLLNTNPPASSGVMYGMAGLLKIIDAEDNETAKTYLMAAGLPVAQGRGQRQQYTQEQAERFAKQVIAKPTRKAHLIAADLWLQKQKVGTNPTKIR